MATLKNNFCITKDSLNKFAEKVKHIYTPTQAKALLQYMVSTADNPQSKLNSLLSFDYTNKLYDVFIRTNGEVLYKKEKLPATGRLANKVTSTITLNDRTLSLSEAVVKRDGDNVSMVFTYEVPNLFKKEGENNKALLIWNDKGVILQQLDAEGNIISEEFVKEQFKVKEGEEVEAQEAYAGLRQYFPFNEESKHPNQLYQLVLMGNTKDVMNELGGVDQLLEALAKITGLTENEPVAKDHTLDGLGLTTDFLNGGDLVQNTDTLIRVEQMFSVKERNEIINLLAGMFSDYIDILAEKEPYGASRYDIVKKYKPAAIWKKIFEDLKLYSGDHSMQHKKQVIVNQKKNYLKHIADLYSNIEDERTKNKIISAIYGYSKFELGQDWCNNLIDTANKLLSSDDILKYFINRTNYVLRKKEGIKITNLDKAEKIVSEESKTEQDASLEGNNDSQKEEQGKDSWLMKVGNIPVVDRMAENIRRIVSHIPIAVQSSTPLQQYEKEITTSDGRRAIVPLQPPKYVMDKYGNVQYYDTSYVIETILSITNKMLDEDQLIPLLEANIEKYPWLETVVSILKQAQTGVHYRTGKPLNNTEMAEVQKEFSEFYRFCRQDYNQMVIGKYENKRSTKDSRKTYYNAYFKELNKESGYKSLLDSFRSVIQQGDNVSEPDAIYDADGNYDVERAVRLVKSNYLSKMPAFEGISEDTLAPEHNILHFFYDSKKGKNRTRKCNRLYKDFMAEDVKENNIESLYYMLRQIGVRLAPGTLETILDPAFHNKTDLRAGKEKAADNLGRLIAGINSILLCEPTQNSLKSKGGRKEDTEARIREAAKTVNREYKDNNKSFDFINHFPNSYNLIASAIATTNEDTYNKMVIENGKNYASYTPASHLGNIIKAFKIQLDYLNSYNPETGEYDATQQQEILMQGAKKFIDKIKNNWLNKDPETGEYINYIYDLLCNETLPENEEQRNKRILEIEIACEQLRKVDMKAYNNKENAEQTSIERYNMLWAAFNSQRTDFHSTKKIKTLNIGVNWAFYQLYTLSDSGNDVFLRLPYYKLGSNRTEEGTFGCNLRCNPFFYGKYTEEGPSRYDITLTKELTKLIKRELRRIEIVKDRDAIRQMYKKYGDKCIGMTVTSSWGATEFTITKEMLDHNLSIDNYDIVRDENGNITNPGGSVFSLCLTMNNVLENAENVAKLIEDYQKGKAEKELRENNTQVEVTEEQAIEFLLKNKKVTQDEIDNYNAWMLANSSTEEMNAFLLRQSREWMNADFVSTLKNMEDEGFFVFNSRTGKASYAINPDNSGFGKVELAQEFSKMIEDFSRDFDKFLPNIVKDTKVLDEKKNVIDATKLNNVSEETQEAWKNFREYMLQIKEITDQVAASKEENKYIAYNKVNIVKCYHLYEEFMRAFSKEDLGNQINKNDPEQLENLKILEIKLQNSNILTQLYDFTANYTLQQANMIIMTVDDTAYFKGAGDMQKRFKGNASATEKFNKNATIYTNFGIPNAPYQTVTVGKDHQRVLILTDDFVESSYIEYISAVYDQAIKEGKMTEKEKEEQLAAFKNINTSDAQAYRTMKSNRAMKAMLGEWGQMEEEAYWDIMRNRKARADNKFFAQTTKNFSHGTNTVSMGVERNGKEVTVEVPFQVKMSDRVLIPEIEGSIDAMSPKMRALAEFMDQAGIDLVVFESGIKAGIQGRVNINQSAIDKEITENYPNFADLSKAEQDRIMYKITYDKLVQASGVKPHPSDPNVLIDGNPAVLHDVPVENFGKQNSTKEHFLDKEQSVPVQGRRIIVQDMDPDFHLDDITDANGNNIPMKNKEEIMEWYNKLHVYNIAECAQKFEEMGMDKVALSKKLQETIKNNANYDEELLEAVTLDENGEFRESLNDPVFGVLLQQMFCSIARDMITKQKMPGGTLIQATSSSLNTSKVEYVDNDELEVVFKLEDGTEISWQKFHSKPENKRKTKKEYIAYMAGLWKEKKLSLAYYDAIIPAYDTRIYDKYRDPVTGQVDMSKVPEELRHILAERVPTEAKYSMMHMRVKQFSNSENGTNVLLPLELTAITGSDFDVDKLYTICPFIENKMEGDLERAYSDFLRLQDESFLKLSEEKQKKKFEEWVNKNKEEYNIRYELRKIKYDNNKTIKDNSLEARSNMILDMQLSILSSPKNAALNLTPGGFDPLKCSAYRGALLTEYSMSEVLDVIKKKKIKYTASDGTCTISEKGNAAVAAFKDIGLYCEMLMTMSSSDITKIFKTLDSKLSTTSVGTLVKQQQQNAAGGNMIGIYANSDSNNAIMQNAKLTLHPDYQLEIDGSKKTKISSIYTTDPDMSSIMSNGKKEKSESKRKLTYISKNICQYLAAAVDTAKDPILKFLRQNQKTVDVTMLLVRMGVSNDQIMLILNQPVVQQALEYIKQTPYMSFEEALKKAKTNFMTVLGDVDFENGVENKENETARKAHQILGLTNRDVLADSMKLDSRLMTKDIVYGKIKKENSEEYVFDSSLVNTSEGGHATFKNKELALYYHRQAAMAETLIKLNNAASVLNDIVLCTRQDSQSAAAGRDVAGMIHKKLKIDHLYNKLENKTKCPIRIGKPTPNSLVGTQYDNNTDRELSVQDEILQDSAIPIIGAFYTYGINASSYVMSHYFKGLRRPALAVIEEINRLIASKNVMSEDLIRKCLLQIDAYVFLGNNPIINNVLESKGITAAELRSQILNSFPSMYALALSKKTKELKEQAEKENATEEDKERYNNFIKLKENFFNRIQKKEASQANRIVTLEYKNNGTVTEELKKAFKEGWQEALNSEDEDIRNLALQLYFYSVYKNGFGFGPTSFMHLCPLSIRKQLGGYESIQDDNELRKFFNPEDGKLTDIGLSFIDQFIRNNLDENQIAPKVNRKEALKYEFIKTDDNNRDRVEDEVTINMSGEKRDVIKQFTDASFISDIRINPRTDKLEITPIPYIKIVSYDTTFYYQCTSSPEEVSDLGLVTYKRIEKLGANTVAIEYEYGNLHTESVLKKQYSNYEKTLYNQEKYDKMQEAAAHGRAVRQEALKALAAGKVKSKTEVLQESKTSTTTEDPIMPGTPEESLEAGNQPGEVPSTLETGNQPTELTPGEWEAIQEEAALANGQRFDFPGSEEATGPQPEGTPNADIDNMPQTEDPELAAKAAQLRNKEGADHTPC